MPFHSKYFLQSSLYIVLLVKFSVSYIHEKVCTNHNEVKNIEEKNIPLICDIIHIVRSSEQYLTLPFYTIEEMISEWIFNWFMGVYTDFRYNRGDNTLLIYLLKKITAFVFRRNIRIYNKYGYSILKIEKERGTMDSATEIFNGLFQRLF